jgi:muramoyltetrapeptide carboxypeptidase
MVQLFGKEEGKSHPITTVGLVATARWMNLNDLQPAINWLNSQGINVKIGGNIETKHGQMAGNGLQKAQEFNDLLHDPEVEALWAVRGGYGSVKMVEHIDWDFWVKRPKPLIGFSDLTIIHAKASKRGIPTIHGEMLLNFFKDEQLQKGILPALELASGKAWSYSWKNTNHQRNGNGQGMLVGGNLSVLVSNVGSLSEFDYQGKILLLEDLDEYLYHIDRMMETLKRAGRLEKLAGMVGGGLTDMKDHQVEFGKQAEEIVWEAVSNYSYPVAFGAPFGHLPNQMPVRLGRTVELLVD